MRTATWVLGYHGCDRDVGEAVLTGKTTLRPSENDWDWLGTGIYFSENSARRAQEWAAYAAANPQFFPTQVKKPFVVGAVIDLGNCLDLLEAESIRLVKETHDELQHLLTTLDTPMPVNAGAHPDRVIRRLDCAVINYLHNTRSEKGQAAFDSVRAAFMEGEPLYPEAGFRARTHIQLCVRRETQIIGYFRVRDAAVAPNLGTSKIPSLPRRAVPKKSVRRKLD